ncbi:hypothetical protein CIPAW_11G055100 [Carya illinoinensis]|uniref:Uncharacterized protein n=1 Tax=Carya illinoinensis TaxID=32201 RepID=A0A8T1P169_CARIL|nr:hypothetical protein CIPAW_11G055100 [Carya illinoinensis]
MKFQLQHSKNRNHRDIKLLILIINNTPKIALKTHLSTATYSSETINFGFKRDQYCPFEIETIPFLDFLPNLNLLQESRKTEDTQKAKESNLISNAKEASLAFTEQTRQCLV